jgi:predicted ATPase
LILELEKAGFQCVHESSREIIHEQMQSGGNFLPWKDLVKFSEIVFERRLEQFQTAPSLPCFFDRGIPDIAAYLDLAGFSVWPALADACKTQRYYHTVFLTPPWPDIFRNDPERKETFASACEVHEAIKKQYHKLGYHCTEIPTGTAEERAAFVIRLIESKGKGL